MPPTSDTPTEITTYRLDQLQLSLQALNAQMASVSTQIMTLQTSLPDRYLTRIEFAEILRQKEMQQAIIDKRLDTVDEHNQRQDEALKDLQNRWETRGWGVAGALLTALIALLVGAVSVVERAIGR